MSSHDFMMEFNYSMQTVSLLKSGGLGGCLGNGFENNSIVFVSKLLLRIVIEHIS